SRGVRPWSVAHGWCVQVVCEEVWMERCVFFHRFGALLCVSLWLSAGVCGAGHAGVLAGVRPLPAQVAPSPPVSSEKQSSPGAAAQPSKSGEYVLSQDRYEKAVRYSRAAYA